MSTNQNESRLQLGEIVAASCELGNSVTADDAMATNLAARHLGRVLAHGGNRRLVAALRDLARELTPAGAHVPPSSGVRRVRSRRSGSRPASARRRLPDAA